MKKDFIMIEMKVMGIAIDTRTNSPIVVLHDANNRKALPIWIGSAEASAIIRKIENIKVIRPMTHDLLLNITDELNYKLVKTEITDVEKETYFANLYFENEEENQIIIDARPSDAIALAIRANSPIFVSESIFASETVSCDSKKDEEEAEEFKKFIQDIKPSDFEKLLKNDKESDQ